MFKGRDIEIEVHQNLDEDNSIYRILHLFRAQRVNPLKCHEDHFEYRQPRCESNPEGLVMSIQIRGKGATDKRKNFPENIYYLSNLKVLKIF